jgi:glutamate-1-semialdehyde aminotransferase
VAWVLVVLAAALPAVAGGLAAAAFAGGRDAGRAAPAATAVSSTASVALAPPVFFAGLFTVSFIMAFPPLAQPASRYSSQTKALRVGVAPAKPG